MSAPTVNEDLWWLGRLSREVGDLLAGYCSLAEMRSLYRQFYASPSVQADDAFKRSLPAPTKKKVKLDG